MYSSNYGAVRGCIIFVHLHCKEELEINFRIRIFMNQEQNSDFLVTFS